MSSKTIKYILALMLFIIISLFITQAYWFQKSFAVQERQFDEQLNIALRSVADKLLKLDQDSIAQIPPITHLASNEFLVKTQCYFSLATLDSCLKQEFAHRNMGFQFDYFIIKEANNEIILGNSFFNLFESEDIGCKQRTDEKELLDFKIIIHNKTAYLINAMGIWLFSSISLLALLAVFTFIVVAILKSKKLSLLKKDFVNNMTHELKTPIANIAVASEAIRSKDIQLDNDKLKKYADIIHHENIRLHHLVDRVLQISAIEKKEASLVFETCNLHEMIHAISFNFTAMVQQQQGRLTEALEAENYMLQADALHLNNVLYNLIENAIKYSKHKPEITISTANTKGGITIAVQDRGIGISQENQHRVFEQFFRAETGNLHNTKGYGLGLSYVKLIVAKHGGCVTFRSKENEGSTFNIFLPQ